MDIKSAKYTFSKMASNKVTGEYLGKHKSPTYCPLNRTGVFLEVAKYELFLGVLGAINGLFTCHKCLFLAVFRSIYLMFYGDIFMAIFCSF